MADNHQHRFCFITTCKSSSLLKERECHTH
ncbi:hypothetical protein M8C21_018022 [Ambrosia artemisiifolia]|uniref:Uncharacterized protein n=1 Tax=Ambrosia artemisiifolia TaxID=4212 RepID=A0AAD5C683_AMBAR|nr:hypothetical protein M8C21_018022 [Ambrosia artemisiifolia]